MSELRVSNTTTILSAIGTVIVVLAFFDARMSEFNADIKADIRSINTDLSVDITGLKTDLRADVMGLKTDLQAEIKNLDDDLGGVRADISLINQSLIDIAERVGRIEERTKPPRSTNLPGASAGTPATDLPVDRRGPRTGQTDAPTGTAR